MTRDLARGGDAALVASKEQFAKDQRPYVWPAQLVMIPPKAGEQVRVNVFFLNYGKTPALRETSLSKVLVFTSEEVRGQVDSYFDNFDETKISGGSVFIVPPGILPDPLKSEARTTARSDFVPNTQADADVIQKTDFSYAVIGVVIYYDAAGTHYRSDYCAMHLADGLMAWCPKHNDIR